MYSAAEAGYLALQCPQQEHYHIQSESALVEVLDEAGNPCRPGETGTMVVTPLHNFAMPLIRYAIGDIAEVGAPCACGRGLPVLARLLGRVRQMLVLPSGARRYGNVGDLAFARDRGGRPISSRADKPAELGGQAGRAPALCARRRGQGTAEAARQFRGALLRRTSATTPKSRARRAASISNSCRRSRSENHPRLPKATACTHLCKSWGRRSRLAPLPLAGQGSAQR